MVSKVVTRITLEGVEDIKAKLASLGVTGEKAMQQIRAAGGALSGGGLGGAGDQLQKLGLRTLEAKSAADAFREAIHIAHPVLEEAGLGLGNLGAFARLAGAGLGAVAATAAAAAIIGLAKLGDQAKKTKELIDQVYGPKSAPGAEERIKQIARGLGTSTEAVLDPVAQLRDTEGLRGRTFFGGDQRAEQEVTALQQLARITGSSQEEAAKAATDLFGAFHKQALDKETPHLTNEILEGLPRGLRNEFSSLLGSGPDATRLERRIQGGSVITSDDLLRRLDFRAPAIDREFRELPAEKRLAGDQATGVVEAAKTAVASGPGAVVSTLGIKLSDELAHEIGRANQPDVLQPGGPGTALDSLLRGTAGQDISTAVRGVLPTPVGAPAEPLPFAAALAARTPLPAGATVNAAPQIDQLGQAAGRAASQLDSIKAPAGATVPAAAPAEISGHAEGGVIIQGSILPRLAAGGHVLARVSNGERFFPPKEVAAIGLPTLQAINSLTSGGRIRGPGTGTSDSILASLPAGGFVLNARASGMIDGLAEGGPIEFDHPLSSSSSMSANVPDTPSHDSPGTAVHLHFPDRSFNNLRASSQTAEELRNYSLGRQVASTGTRPSWVGG
jgi:hypothetical protein